MNEDQEENRNALELPPITSAEGSARQQNSSRKKKKRMKSGEYTTLEVEEGGQPDQSNYASNKSVASNQPIVSPQSENSVRIGNMNVNVDQLMLA